VFPVEVCGVARVSCIHRRIIIILVSFFATLGIILIIFFTFLYTPTTTLRIQNDSAETLTISGCGSDPATLSPGQQVDIDPNLHDANAACTVYEGNTGIELGCLYTPTTRYTNGSTIRLSAMVRGIPASRCGG
jgi:hypothetical protein